MGGLLKDVRYAGRGLLRNPGVAAIAVLALALGIGFSTVMFSIVYGALHRGLPFDDPDRIVALFRSNPELGFERMGVPIHDYADWRERQRVFEDVGAYFAGTVNVRGSERPDRYTGGFITPNTLSILGVQPILGRAFTSDDARPGGPMNLLLGYRVWQDRYGGDRGALGQAVVVNGEPGEIIGVLPDGFEFPFNQEVWVPLRLDPLELPRGTGQSTTAFAKLRPGVSIDQAVVELTGIARQLADEYPETNQGIVPVVIPFTESWMGGEERTLLYTMMITVFMVLLIACANVANLLLARAAVRTRDVAIRTALGASRFRVVTQLMSEALILAAVGALLGAAVAWVGIDMFARAIVVSDPPFWFNFALDGPILLFVIGVAGVSALVSGAIPAIRASSTDVNAILKDESRGSSSLQMGRLSRGLVVAEVAMSMALLVSAGLLIRSSLAVTTMEYGYPTQDVFTARIGLFEERYPDADARHRFWEDVEDRVAAIPGVRSAALVGQLPGMGSNGSSVAHEGVSYVANRDLPSTRWVIVTPAFFSTFDVEPIEGRPFTELDSRDAPPVALINRSFLREHFPDGQAVGRRIRLGNLESEEPWREIVGVVIDTGMEGVGNPGQNSPAGVFVPLAQSDARFASVAARTSGQPLSITPQVRDAVLAADPDTPIYFVQTLQEGIDQNTWFYRIFGTLFTVFGAGALFLASVGLYGVMSFTVSRRVHEMGIRMALGAQAAQVRALVLRQGMSQILIGVVIGTGLAVLVSRGLATILYEAEPWDPATYVLVFLLLAATGLVATFLPARRATLVDPNEALRYE